MPDTLVVDSLGNPIRAIPWWKAVTKVRNNQAQVLTEAADRVLRSACFEMYMPTTIRMRNWNRKHRARRVPLNRHNIMIRDNSTCQYCGKVVTTHSYSIDHVIPRSRGGRTTWENAVLACQSCNWKKASKTLAEAGMRLLRPPTVPSPGDSRYFKIFIRKMRPEWKAWETWLYWNVELEK